MKLRVIREGKERLLDPNELPMVFYLRHPSGAAEKVIKVHEGLFRSRLVRKIPPGADILNM